jgi:hypothetical protein
MLPEILRLSSEEHALLNRAANWPGCSWAELTPDAVRRLTRREGIDFATALLFHRARCSETHGPFIRRLEAMPEWPVGDWVRDTTVGIVPGAFYVEHPETGADGSLILEQAARLGCHTARVPVRSFGTLRENARILSEWLVRQPERPLILVSLSKGGAEVKWALQEPNAARTFRHVVAWVNVSGLIRGTAIVNWLFRRPWRALLVRLMLWYQGHRFDVLRDLEYGKGGPLDCELVLPRDLLAVHLFGFPPAHRLSGPLARRGHRRLTPLGPNDGGANLLTDLLGLPGLIYPVWGADHYLRPNWDVGALIRRLLCFVGEERLSGLSTWQRARTASVTLPARTAPVIVKERP